MPLIWHGLFYCRKTRLREKKARKVTQKTTPSKEPPAKRTKIQRHRAPIQHSSSPIQGSSSPIQHSSGPHLEPQNSSQNTPNPPPHSPPLDRGHRRVPLLWERRVNARANGDEALRVGPWRPAGQGEVPHPLRPLVSTPVHLSPNPFDDSPTITPTTVHLSPNFDPQNGPHCRATVRKTPRFPYTCPTTPPPARSESSSPLRVGEDR